MIWKHIKTSWTSLDPLDIGNIQVYHHEKYGCIYFRGSWDIDIWKMGQSDWPSAFFKISREPDFSKTCGFRWIMQDSDLNRFKIKEYTFFNNSIGESSISVRYGHARACLGSHVTPWNICMTSSQSGLPPCEIGTYLLKKFMGYWDLKNGAIW